MQQILNLDVMLAIVAHLEVEDVASLCIALELSANNPEWRHFWTNLHQRLFCGISTETLSLSQLRDRVYRASKVQSLWDHNPILPKAVYAQDIVQGQFMADGETLLGFLWDGTLVLVNQTSVSPPIVYLPPMNRPGKFTCTCRLINTSEFVAVVRGL